MTDGTWPAIGGHTLWDAPERVWHEGCQATSGSTPWWLSETVHLVRHRAPTAEDVRANG